MSSPSKPIVVVASATAKTAQGVLSKLSESGQVTVRAVVRDASKPTAVEVGKLPNVELVEADFLKPETLAAAVKGAWRAFLVGAAGTPAQRDMEVNFLTAAKEAELDLVVRVSTCTVLIDADKGGVYGKAHAQIEQWIADNKARVIDLMPSWFMANFTGTVAQGKLYMPVESGDIRAPRQIHPRDVGGAAAAILLRENNDDLLAVNGGRLEVHGPEPVSLNQFLATLERVVGKPFELVPITKEQEVATLVSYGLSELFATSFASTKITCFGNGELFRPTTNTTSPELAAFWKPEVTVEQYVQENKAAFEY